MITTAPRPGELPQAGVLATPREAQSRLAGGSRMGIETVLGWVVGETGVRQRNVEGAHPFDRDQPGKRRFGAHVAVHAVRPQAVTTRTVVGIWSCPGFGDGEPSGSSGDLLG